MRLQFERNKELFYIYEKLPDKACDTKVIKLLLISREFKDTFD